MASGELDVTLQFRDGQRSADDRADFAGLVRELLMRALADIDAPALAEPAVRPLAHTDASDAVPPGKSIEPAAPSDHSPLSGADEELVAKVWESILGVAPSHRDDRFTDLGGDSLAAIKAVPHFARHGITVRAAELMRRGTVAAQAGLVADRRAEQ